MAIKITLIYLLLTFSLSLASPVALSNPKWLGLIQNEFQLGDITLPQGMFYDHNGKALGKFVGARNGKLIFQACDWHKGPQIINPLELNPNLMQISRPYHLVIEIASDENIKAMSNIFAILRQKWTNDQIKEFINSVDPNGDHQTITNFLPDYEKIHWLKFLNDPPNSLHSNSLALPTLQRFKHYQYRYADDYGEVAWEGFYLGSIGEFMFFSSSFRFPLIIKSSSFIALKEGSSGPGGVINDLEFGRFYNLLNLLDLNLPDSATQKLGKLDG